ncbi:hypothetical protein [Actinokineospora sp. HUAS TT18]|uniref:hypothetical protein n=1 Tax=Actinokineospora sp. HUAS TT18 TaxID=3447451 RepID=UPI003F5286D4
MRTKLQDDSQLLSSLDPDTTAYQRLQSRIERDTNQLLDLEEAAERRRALAAEYARAEYQRQEDNAVKGGGAIMALIGFVVVYGTWGSWWLLAGLALMAIGIGAVFTDTR